MGVRSATITSLGFADVDCHESHSEYTPLLRAAAGVGAWYISGRSRYGLVVLLEATAAENRDATLRIHDPNTPSIVRQEQQVVLDGNSLGGVAGVSMGWNW